MTVQDKNTIKSYFETGDQPTQAQFSDLIDSYVDTSAGTISTLTVTGSGNPGTGIIRSTTADPYGFYTRLSANDLAFYAASAKNLVVRSNMWLSLTYGSPQSWCVIGGGSNPTSGGVESSIIITGESLLAPSSTMRITAAGSAGQCHFVQKIKGDSQDPTQPDAITNSITHFNAGTIITSPVSSVEGYIGVAAGLNGNPASISVQRPTTSQNPELLIYTVSTGSITFKSDNTNCFLFKMNRVASAENYLATNPSVTGISPSLVVAGNDANRSMALFGKGTGGVQLGTNSATVQVRVTHTAGATDTLTLTGGASAATIGITGSNSADLILAPSGNGVVQFGAKTSSADVPIDGYVTIKLANGQTCKLATIN